MEIYNHELCTAADFECCYSNSLLPMDGCPDDKAPPFGTFFDPHVLVADAAGDALVGEVVKLLPQRRGRGRRINPDEIEMLVRAILANGLRCSFHRETPFVAHFRRASKYTDGPSWLSSRKLLRVVEWMGDLGLLTLNAGRRHRASTYAVTDKLQQLAADCGVTRNSVVACVPSKQLLRLYSAKPKREPWERKGKRTLLNFSAIQTV